MSTKTRLVLMAQVRYMNTKMPMNKRKNVRSVLV
jgi:hypothetical protein